MNIVEIKNDDTIVEEFNKFIFKENPFKIEMFNKNIIHTLNQTDIFQKNKIPDLSTVYELLKNKNLIVVGLPIVNYCGVARTISDLLSINDIKQYLIDGCEVLIYSLDYETYDENTKFWCKVFKRI